MQTWQPDSRAHTLHRTCSLRYSKVWVLMSMQVELNFLLYKQCFNKQLYVHICCTYACILWIKSLKPDPVGRTYGYFIFSVLCLSNLSVISNSFRPHGLQPTRLLCPWDSPGKNTGVGCHALLHGLFPTQGLNPGLPHCRQILYCLSYQGSQEHQSGQPIPLPGDLPDPGNRTGVSCIAGRFFIS